MNRVDNAPAAGAALDQVIGASAAAMLATGALLYLGWAHRTGRRDVLRRVAALAARDTGFEPWAALPSLIAAGSLLVAVVGMYWDISLHIDQGRDAGPLANPAHYLILAGLFGIFVAGFLAIVLPDRKPSDRAIRISGDWYAPLGGVAMLAAAAFALIGFPLDDVWHRIFGQDVTLWGPTHLMLIGGAGLTLIGSAILIVEGRGERRAAAPTPAPIAAIARHRRVYAAGGLLLGLSTFQAEFDFGVPQFQLVLEPIMLAFAAGIALVAARVWIGAGAALAAAVFFVVVRGLLSLLVGDVFGETTPHFPLYLAEALCVEGVALFVAPRARPYGFGAAAGLLIGTVGFAAEYAWSHVWMPYPWPQNLIGEAIIPVIATAVAAGVLGGFLGASLSAARDRRAIAAPALGPAAGALVAIIVAVGLNVGDQSPPDDWSARVSLDNATGGAERTVDATVRLDPPGLAAGADWFNALAWQGGGKLVIDRLEQVSPGVYRTSEPLPANGTWKTLLRLQRGNTVAGMPIYLPADTAIPAPAVKAKPSFERSFTDETQILQREQKQGVPGSLAALAYSVVAAIVAALIVLLGWVLTRIAREPGGRRDRRRGDPAERANRPRREATA